MFVPFLIKRLRQPAHRKFGCAVNRHARDPENPGGGGRVEQARIWCLFEIDKTGLRAIEHAPEIHINDQIIIFNRRFGKRATPTHTGIVKQNIHSPARRVPERRQRAVPIGAVPNIKPVLGALPGGQQRSRFRHPGFVDIGEPNEPALVREKLRHRAANARRSAGDEDGFAVYHDVPS